MHPNKWRKDENDEERQREQQKETTTTKQQRIHDTKHKTKEMIINQKRLCVYYCEIEKCNSCSLAVQCIESIEWMNAEMIRCHGISNVQMCNANVLITKIIDILACMREYVFYVCRKEKKKHIHNHLFHLLPCNTLMVIVIFLIGKFCSLLHDHRVLFALPKMDHIRYPLIPYNDRYLTRSLLFNPCKIHIIKLMN